MDFGVLLPMLEETRRSSLSNENHKKLDLSRPIVLMPCVYNYENIVPLLLEHGIRICGLCDNNNRLHGKVLGSTVVSSIDK